MGPLGSAENNRTDTERVFSAHCLQPEFVKGEEGELGSCYPVIWYSETKTQMCCQLWAKMADSSPIMQTWAGDTRDHIGHTQECSVSFTTDRINL